MSFAEKPVAFNFEPNEIYGLEFPMHRRGALAASSKTVSVMLVCHLIVRDIYRTERIIGMPIQR